VMSATTDSVGVINFDFDKQPGISNLLQILSLLNGKPQDEIVKNWTGKTSYGELKSATAEAVKTFLTDFQTRLAEVDKQRIMQKLQLSEAAMNLVANETLLKVQKAVGLRA